jgi:hypothetical protein
MDEGRKRVLLVAATILAARKLAQFDKGGWPTLSLISTPEGGPLLSRLLRQGGVFDFFHHRPNAVRSGPDLPFDSRLNGKPIGGAFRPDSTAEAWAFPVLSCSRSAA